MVAYAGRFSCCRWPYTTCGCGDSTARRSRLTTCGAGVAIVGAGVGFVASGLEMVGAVG